MLPGLDPPRYGCSHEELDSACDVIARLVHADEVVISRNLPELRCVETLTTHLSTRRGERFSYADYPMTEHIVREQAIGQIIVGDDAADRAEVDLLQATGYGAALFASAVFRAETVGLLEVYRFTPRPWSDAEIDRARVVAHHLGVVALEVGAGVDGGSFARSRDRCASSSACSVRLTHAVRSDWCPLRRLTPGRGATAANLRSSIRGG